MTFEILTDEMLEQIAIELNYKFNIGGLDIETVTPTRIEGFALLDGREIDIKITIEGDYLTLYSKSINNIYFNTLGDLMEWGTLFNA